MSELPLGFALSRAGDADWDNGLREFFAYRDLGVTTTSTFNSSTC
jgi:hypothetical protein